MKLTEEIILSKHHYAPVGAPINRYSISYISIDILIDNLHQQGVMTNSDYSEKEVKYSIKRGKRSSEERITVVPLATQFPHETTPITFYLRDESSLELELRNYENITQRPPQGIIGGAFAGDFGIVCKLTIEEENVNSQ